MRSVVSFSGWTSFTHSTSSAISASDNFAFPFGGICKSGLAWRTALMSKLFSGSPGTTAGPESPPMRIAPSESSTRPFLDFFAAWLWHSWQCFASNGSTRSLNKASASAAPALAQNSGSPTSTEARRVSLDG